ncbi:MAG TPA: HEAT repeat domain-containing protein [Polyangiales bacterium]|nr:HEAT repeat domain-containing protein [Polyangiales bacterium]
MDTARYIARSAGLLAALLLALGAETAALWQLAANAPLTALAWHAIAALASALLGSLLNEGARSAACVAFALALTLPGIGFLGLSWVILPHWARARRAAERELLELELPEFHQREGGSFDTEQGFQPIEEALSPERPVEHRVRSVMALRRMDPRRAVPLLRLALADSSEDVRLLAYAILERREKQIRQRIERALGELRENPAEPLRLMRSLAHDHWELVYGGFSEGEAQTLNLNQAAHWAEAALHAAFDGTTALLLARVRLSQGDGAAAWRLTVSAAEHAGVASDVCAPLLAEAAFLLRNFDWIPRLLANVYDNPLQSPRLQPVARFWNTGAMR